MRNQSIIAGLVIMVALVVTTNAQNHSSVGQASSTAIGKSENRTPLNTESKGISKEVTNHPEANKPLVDLSKLNSSFSLSKIDAQVVKEFQKAWQISGNGTLDKEGLVLIFANPDGSYKAVAEKCRNDSRKFTFTWNPKIIAVVHTHPKGDNPKPSGHDLALADRFGVPVITITFAGMFMYHPATRKTSKVMDGVTWLDPSKWQQKASLKN